MDCPHRIPPSGTPAHCHRSQSLHRHSNRSTSHHITMTDTDMVGPDHNPILINTSATVTMIPTEAAPGHTIGIADNITGILHDAHTQMLISTILEGHLLTEAHQLTHEIAADNVLSISLQASYENLTSEFITFQKIPW